MLREECLELQRGQVWKDKKNKKEVLKIEEDSLVDH